MDSSVSPKDEIWFFARVPSHFNWSLQPDRSQMTIRRIRSTCWITTASNTRAEYVMHIAFHGKNGHANAPNVTLPVLFVYRYDIGIGFVHVPDAWKEVCSSYCGQYLARCAYVLVCLWVGCANKDGRRMYVIGACEIWMQNRLMSGSSNKMGLCMCELTLWRGSVIFVPPQLHSHLDPT